MTENYSPAAPGAYADPPLTPPRDYTPPDYTQPATNPAYGGDPKDAAKDQASQLGQGAAEAGQHVAGVAKEQTSQVASEAVGQAKALFDQTQGQVKEQAGAQQQKLVGGLRSLSDELGAMAGHAEEPGVASDLARQAADRTSAVAGWLDGREPKAILDDISSFARRRPGAFLTIAAGIGFLGGRLTRGLSSNAGSDGSAGASISSPTPSTSSPATASSPDSIDLDARTTSYAPHADLGSHAVPPVAPAVGLSEPLAQMDPLVIPGSPYVGEDR